VKKLVGGIVIVLVLAAAGFTGAAYWSGMQAQRWYEEALAEGAKNPNVKLSTVSYQRGLFSSQSVTRIQFAMPEGSPGSATDPSFAIRQDIYHGPLPLAGRGIPDVPMQWTGAVVRAVLESDSSAWTRELAKAYGSQLPLVAISQISFDGASDTRVVMPPLTLNNIDEIQTLKFSGLQGQFQVAPKAAAVQGSMSVASLEALGKPVAASEGQPVPSAGQVNLRDLKLTVDQRQGAFDLLFGESNFKISELSAKDQNTDAPFLINNLSISGSLTPQGSQQVAAEMLIKADKVTVNQHSGEGSLKLALRNLDGATIAQLQQWQQKFAANPNDPQQFDTLLKLIKALLDGKPEFLIDSQAKVAQGDWKGKLTLNFQSLGEVNPLLDPSGMLKALEKGAADMAVSRPLLEALLINIAKETTQAESEAADETAIHNQAAQQVAQQLQGLTAAGFITLDGNTYQSSARFEGGKLSVNGKDIPLTAGADDSAAEGEISSGEDEIPSEPDAAVEPAPPQ